MDRTDKVLILVVVGLVLALLVSSCASPQVAASVLQEQITVLKDGIKSMSSDLDTLNKQLQELQASGALPEEIKPVTDAIDELVSAKGDMEGTLEVLETKLEDFMGNSGGNWPQLVLAIVTGLVGSPIVNRYVPNKFLTRGAVADSRKVS
jgi:uncharacterized membrane protein YraQ (UPF0718 family)